MGPAPFRVILDANVLYPFTLRDTLLRAAEAGLYQAYWTQHILDEACRNLVLKSGMTVEQAQRLQTKIGEAFPESMVDDYQPLVAAMQNHPKDRHVAAAAVKAAAQVIVTSNLRDFTVLPAGIEAKSPDSFLCELFDLSPELMVDILYQQASALTKPQTTVAVLLTSMSRLVPQFVQLVVSVALSK